MITKHAVVLAIILGIASGLLPTRQQQGVDPTHDLYGDERGPAQSNVDRAATAPAILAQGRCYNGRCY